MSSGSHAVALVTAVKGVLEEGGGPLESALAVRDLMSGIPSEDYPAVVGVLAALAASLLPEDEGDARIMLAQLGRVFAQE